MRYHPLRGRFLPYPRAFRENGANSGLRLIYSYFEGADKIELVEIYFKGDQENEDRDRIVRNYR